MRAIAIALVLILVGRVYLDPTSDGIQSLSEAVFFAGLGIGIVLFALPRRRGRSLLWTALAIHFFNRKKRYQREVPETHRRSTGRAHRNEGANHQGSTLQRGTAARDRHSGPPEAARRTL